MGARNALKVYKVAAGHSDHSVRLLGYMALRSLDKDTEPWCRLGHEALAIEGLGRDPAGDDVQARAANERTVQRALTPLLKAGILETVKGGARQRKGDLSAATYRLHLDLTPDAKRPALKRPASTPRGRSGQSHTGRLASSTPDVSRTETGFTPDAKRPTNEYYNQEYIRIRPGGAQQAPPASSGNPPEHTRLAPGLVAANERPPKFTERVEPREASAWRTR